MVTIASLWLAILVASVIVWIASALIWTVLPHHKSDYKGLPDEDAARQALAPQDLKPGMYFIPHIKSQADMKNPEIVKKYNEGPVTYFAVLPKGVPAMGKSMILSFLYYIVVNIFIAYLVSRTLDPSAAYLSVFRVAGAVSWLAYGFAIVPDSIWFGRPWSFTVKYLIDALVYALLTAGVFGWLWPS
jgi:hypothetical protein